MSRLMTDARTTECEDRARILETEFAKRHQRCSYHYGVSVHNIYYLNLYETFIFENEISFWYIIKIVSSKNAVDGGRGLGRPQLSSN